MRLRSSTLARPLLAALCWAGAGSALAAECRPGDLPPGVRAERVPNCPPSAPRRDDSRLRAGSQPGFLDLGNGTEVRIGGRARIEYEGRR